MDYICESRFGDAAGVSEELYGEVHQCAVFGEDEVMHVIGWIFTELASGNDVSIMRKE